MKKLLSLLLILVLLLAVGCGKSGDSSFGSVSEETSATEKSYIEGIDVKNLAAYARDNSKVFISIHFINIETNQGITDVENVYDQVKFGSNFEYTVPALDGWDFNSVTHKFHGKEDEPVSTNKKLTLNKLTNSVDIFFYYKKNASNKYVTTKVHTLTAMTTINGVYHFDVHAESNVEYLEFERGSNQTIERPEPYEKEYMGYRVAKDYFSYLIDKKDMINSVSVTLNNIQEVQNIYFLYIPSEGVEELKYDVSEDGVVGGDIPIGEPVTITIRFLHYNLNPEPSNGYSNPEVSGDDGIALKESNTVTILSGENFDFDIPDLGASQSYQFAKFLYADSSEFIDTTKDNPLHISNVRRNLIIKIYYLT